MPISLESKPKGITAAPAFVLGSARRRRGFTLIELLVYMAIMGFVIVVAGRAFSDSTGMRLRSQNMLASAEETGRVSAILKEDISQMGAKSWGLLGENGYVFDTVASVCIKYGSSSNPATDFSSYALTTNEDDNFDKLTFRKLHYDSDGVCGRLMDIEWYVADSVLFRKCTPTAVSKCTGSFVAADCPNIEVEMARFITEFKFSQSMPISSDILYSSGNDMPKFSVKHPNGNASFDATGSFSGFVQNSSSSGVARTDIYLSTVSGSCEKLKFIAGEEYAIEFTLPYTPNASDPCKSGSENSCSKRYNEMAMFQAGRDHLSVGLRNANMDGSPIDGVPDFLFYPPQENEDAQIRRFDFSVSEDIEAACIGITAAFYSPAARGHLDIKNFKVYVKTDKVYHFPEDYSTFTTKDKANVKAFRLELGVRKGSGARTEESRVTTTIPVPSNGVAGGSQ